MNGPSPEDIALAAETLAGRVVRTPLLPLSLEDGRRVWLKPEVLQPVGSFKLRGALNAMLRAGPEALAPGVVTASAGNMAAGVAWAAREMGIRCTVVVPDHAPRAKLDAIARLGGEVVPVPFDRWWQTLEDGGMPGIEGHFVHPVEDPDVMAGNGTIGLEICDDLPTVATVVVPFGGGGLACGIATALRARRPQARVVTVEPSTAAPFAAALQAGQPVERPYTPTFIDGAGGRAVLPGMWPLASSLVQRAVSVSPDRTAEAIRLLSGGARLVAEGAGALSLAAVLDGAVPADEDDEVVCVVSGGVINPETLASILMGATP